MVIYNYYGINDLLTEDAWPIIEKGDYILWGKDIPYLRVPNSDRANLEAGAPRFISFFEKISESKFPSMVVDLESKVDELKREREDLIIKLKNCLLYTGFPGECKYLV